MHAVEIFLPLSDDEGNRFEAELFGKVRRELVERFGGLTAFTQSPAEGLWEDEGEVSRDEIVIFEVMADGLDRGWWRLPATAGEDVRPGGDRHPGARGPASLIRGGWR